MKHSPIIFTAPLVRAILTGQKTETRRLADLHNVNEDPDLYHHSSHAGGEYWKLMHPPGSPVDPTWYKCRYGTRGDTLWVRENWKAPNHCQGIPPRNIPPGTPIHYMADGTARTWGQHRRSIFMMEWMSRLTLTITNIRLQRLHEITRDEALKEGMPEGETRSHALECFFEAWDRINKKNQVAMNPWVWAITFTTPE